MSASSGKSGVTPAKKVSEWVRERETLRYYSSLRAAGIVDHSGQAPSSSRLSACNDSMLNALAQLGVFKTGADRALISLFDADNQYVIAEATSSSPLQAPTNEADHTESLWLCGSTIPRGQGVCEAALLSEDAFVADGLESHQTAPKLPITLVNDLTSDDPLMSKRSCPLSSLCRSYAAVPIRSRRGINIGVYCVVSATPAQEWTEDHTSKLRDMSHSVMEYLETKRLEVLYRRSSRMNRGLGSFIEGESTLSGWQSGQYKEAFTDESAFEGHLNTIQQELLLQSDNASSESVHTIVSAPIAALDSSQLSNTDLDPSTTASSTRQNSSNESENSDRTDDASPEVVFSRAANLIRESVVVEGCLFADAMTGAYLSAPPALPTDSATEQNATSSSDDSQDDACRYASVLGFSTSVKSSINGDINKPFARALPEKFLAKLLRRYPKGKIFHFGANGVLQSSDSSEEDSHLSSAQKRESLSKSSSADSPRPFPTHGKRSMNPWAREREGSLLSKAFPGARCVAFTPVWDPRKDRWYAGGFIYTNAPNRSFSEEDELSFLRAFGILTMAELLREIDLQADKAKSDILGSLSHELRSPLHGVILSAELLAETKLSVFQGNTAHTIEICSRTLLDTIDHLLDYSKINRFADKGSKRNSKLDATRQAGAPTVMDDEQQLGEKTLSCTCQLDALVEEVVESVFAGYTFQFMSVSQASRSQVAPASPNVKARRQSISIHTVAGFEPISTETVELSEDFGDVSLALCIDVGQNWSFLVQVGAIRRIVMNIVGNALKYTSKGMIKVTLTQETVHIRRRKEQRVVKFTVQDTGKGIGPDFLRNGLYRPFSQEDNLTPGTGLGLSLVKRIVTQLRGEVSVQSEVGVGTTVSVMLPMEQASESLEKPLMGSDGHQTFNEQVEDLKGLRVGISLSTTRREGPIPEWQKAVRDICCGWLTMEIVSSQSTSPELMILSHDRLPKTNKEILALAKTPNVVICPNALVAYERSKSLELADHAAIFEFIAQPVGPRKLARALLLAYTRWMNIVDSPRSSHAVPTRQKRPAVSADVQLQTRPPLNRCRSSSQTASNITDDDCESIFSVIRDENGSEEPTTDNTPNSERPDPLTRFLLVDDNHINLKVLSTYVKKLGIEYDTATNGEEAVKLFCLEQSAYTCVLMDISMPIMDGFEATRCMRAHEHREHLEKVPIIALSGLASEDAQREATGSGMDLLLTKPVQLKTLGSVLSSMGILDSTEGSN